MAQIQLGGSVGAGGAFPILGEADVNITGNADLTLNLAQYSNLFIRVTSDGTSTGVRQVIVPIIKGEAFIVENATSEGFGILVIGASGTGVQVDSGKAALVACDGTNYLVPGTSAPPSSWVAVAAGATVNVPSQNGKLFYAMDSSGAQITMNLPASPVDGQEVLFRNVAASVSSPPLLVAGGTTTVELFGNVGNFSGAGGNTALVTQGALYALKYQLSQTRWIEVG